MKQSLIDLLTELNVYFNGKLIEQNINDYVDKIYKTATIHEIKNKDKIIAFIAYYDNDTNNETAFLTMLAIHSKYQNTGYGKQLMKKTICNLKKQGFKNFDLEVLKSNENAIGFYRKYNFNIIEELVDKYKMRKII